MDAWQDGGWQTIAQAQAVGAQRLLRFPAVTTDRFRLRMTALPVDQPALSEIAFFFEPAV